MAKIRAGFIRQILGSVLISVEAGGAHAAFKITYPEPVTVPETMVQEPLRSLLVNNATRFVIEVGEGTAGRHSASVKNMALSDVLSLLLPDGWRAYSRNVELGPQTVDLVSGESWVDTLERAGRDNQLIFVVDWGRKELTLQPHTEVGKYDRRSVLRMSDADILSQEPKLLYLPAGDLRDAISKFAKLNNLHLEVDRISDERDRRLHPAVSRSTHPIPDCVTWTMPSPYEAVVTEWVDELNRILSPYRLRVIKFANEVIFLTSLHKYEQGFCSGAFDEAR